MRKKTALLLSAALLAGMVAGNGSDLGRVYAAGNTPGVTSFATKEELKTEFKLDGMSDGVEDTVGRLRFGKNAYGEPQIWYIAGTDSGVPGENIVLFAAEPILGKSETDGTTIEGQKFSANKFEDPYDMSQWWIVSIPVTHRHRCIQTIMAGVNSAQNYERWRSRRLILQKRNRV